jgi:hypothetical protein
MRRHSRCPNPHAAELGHFENHIVAPDTVRPIQHRSFGAQAHRQGYQRDRQQQDKSRANADEQIK